MNRHGLYKWEVFSGCRYWIHLGDIILMMTFMANKNPSKIEVLTYGTRLSSIDDMDKVLE